MSGKGRPLRFLALVLLGWISARIAILWPQTGSLPEAIKALAPLSPANPSLAPRTRLAAEATPPIAGAETHSVSGLAPAVEAAGQPGRPPLPAARSVDPLRVQMAMLGLLRYGSVQETTPQAGVAPAMATALDRLPPLPSRWSASAWAAFRPGRGTGAPPSAGQLGGSQAGVRLAYMLAPAERLAAFARFTTPVATRGRELSLGLEWQPGRAPVRLVAEQRFALDGGGSGPGLGVIAGVDADIAQGFRLESYGQAGVIRRRQIEPYVDGAARATHGVAETGGVRLALGAGAWGGAQRDAARLDLGPSATLALPVAGHTLRLALDWRQRVAGRARPGSGPALTIGGDF